jgi:hypothetical protein
VWFVTKVWCDVCELKEVEFAPDVKERVITYCGFRDEEGSCHREEVIVNNKGCKNFVSGDEKKNL